MKMFHFICPLCSSTKTIIDEHNQSDPPKELVCNWQGCPGVMVQNDEHR